MFVYLKTALEDWNSSTDSRKKLQHAYLAAAFALLLAAGIVGLINYDLGQKILFIAIVAGAMFLANSVAWALLQSFVLLRISADELTTRSVASTQTVISAAKKPRKTIKK